MPLRKIGTRKKNVAAAITDLSSVVQFWKALFPTPSITNILNAIQNGIYIATVRDRLEELETERTELEVKIANEKIAKPVLTEKQVEFWLTQLAKNGTDSLEQKRRLIDAFLNSVFLYEDSAVITFNYKFGSKTVSLADIHNYSDLTDFGEP